MSIEEKSPCYRVRITIGDISSFKHWVGYKKRKIEVTYGNQETKRIENPEDVGSDSEYRTMADAFIKAFEETDKVAELRDFQFIDQTKKDEKDNPIK